MVLNSDSYFKNKKEMDMFKVTQNTVPDMTIHVNSGTIIYKNKVINFSEQYSEIITAPKIGTWIVVISVNERAELVYTYGVQSTEEKVIPTLPESCFHLCAIEISASAPYITNDMIYDMRQIFTFSENTDVTCTCKCALDAENTFTEEDRTQLKEFYDKYEELALEIDKLKLLHEPRKTYNVLSDNGIEYEVHFNDNGEMYTKKVGIDNEFADQTDTTHNDYKFVLDGKQVNVVTNDKNFMNINVKIKSFDNANENTNCTLYVRCSNATIYCANYSPQYAEDEFVVSNLMLTKAGYFEQFSLNFHNQGNHVLQLILCDNEKQTVLDKADATYEVTFDVDNQE